MLIPQDSTVLVDGMEDTDASGHRVAPRTIWVDGILESRRKGTANDLFVMICGEQCHPYMTMNKLSEIDNWGRASPNADPSWRDLQNGEVGPQDHMDDDSVAQGILGQLSGSRIALCQIC